MSRPRWVRSDHDYVARGLLLVLAGAWANDHGQLQVGLGFALVGALYIGLAAMSFWHGIWDRYYEDKDS